MFTLIWSDHLSQVSYQANWLNAGQWHVELRCDARLPVTDTGYRSIFAPNAEFSNQGEIAVFLTSLLDGAALSKDWLAYLEDSKQLNLFSANRQTLSPFGTAFS
jgi:hypothetical protein